MATPSPQSERVKHENKSNTAKKLNQLTCPAVSFSAEERVKAMMGVLYGLGVRAFDGNGELVSMKEARYYLIAGDQTGIPLVFDPRSIPVSPSSKLTEKERSELGSLELLRNINRSLNTALRDKSIHEGVKTVIRELKASPETRCVPIDISPADQKRIHELLDKDEK